MNRIKSKDRGIETYEINKISLFCFDKKKYIQNKGCNGLALSELIIKKKPFILLIIYKRSFVTVQKYYSNFLSSQNSFFVELLKLLF